MYAVKESKTKEVVSNFEVRWNAMEIEISARTSFRERKLTSALID